MAPEKKRKLSDQKVEKSSLSSTKKPRTAGQRVKVQHLGGSDVAKPVIGTGTPHTLLSSSLRFSSYSRQNDEPSAAAAAAATGKKKTDSSLLLLHSASHDTIDFSAVESRTVDSNERHLKHYVAVFDPSSRQLNVTEAKKLTVKRQVRKLAQKDAREGEDDGGENTTVVYSSRVALTEAFGSKKSRKAVATIAENRLIANSTSADDPLAKALISTATRDNDDGDEEEEDDDSNEKAGANGNGNAQATKPLPPANLKTTNIADVYALSTLVVPQPTAATLGSMPLTEWRQLLSQKKPIASRYRYIAQRVVILGQRHMQNQSDRWILQTLQVLRYIEFLLDVHRYVSSLPRGRPLPHTDQWPEKSIKDGNQIPAYIVKQVSIHFFPDSRLTDFSLTRLRTFILALTLHMPPGLALSAGKGILAVEPSDVLMDLSLNPAKNLHLYRELGCKVERAKDSEITRWQLRVLEKQNAAADNSTAAAATTPTSKKPMFAKLTLPLEFPKLSQGRAISSGGRR